MKLDTILCPTQASEKRTRDLADSAVLQFKKTHAQRIIVSGGKTPALDKKYNFSCDVAYERIIKKGIKKDKIVRECKSRDSIENILFSTRLFLGKRIGIVGYNSHLKRFDKIIDTAKKQGLLSKQLKFYKIKINELLIEKIYEIPASLFTSIDLNSKLNKPINDLNGLKKTISNYLMKFFS